MRTSTRDLDELRDRATRWLRGRVGGDATVSEMSRPSGNGLSSETLFFTASWDGTVKRCVARLAPAEEAVPVFPSYDLRAQFEVMRLAREKAGIPAPLPLWFEPDPGPLGTPFFVMEAAEGDVPPDVMPYTFEVGLLAALHDTAFTAEELAVTGGGAGLRAHVDAQRAYYLWAHGKTRIPVLERAFDWLESHWPDDPGPDVLTWGDARIGNVMYRDFTPVAVLDWEMAAVGPRELDVSWMIFLHRFFQDLTVAMGLPGMPDFMRCDDVCRTYREITGYEPRDMDFYEMYAALRHGVIMARVWQRRIHFGEQPVPGDPDDLVLHRATIEELLTR
jgi:aminoglycoside phosphotransferase (APT) family kinase protein